MSKEGKETFVNAIYNVLGATALWGAIKEYLIILKQEGKNKY